MFIHSCLTHPLRHFQSTSPSGRERVPLLLPAPRGQRSGPPGGRCCGEACPAACGRQRAEPGSRRPDCTRPRPSRPPVQTRLPPFPRPGRQASGAGPRGGALAGGCLGAGLPAGLPGRGSGPQPHTPSGRDRTRVVLVSHVRKSEAGETRCHFPAATPKGAKPLGHRGPPTESGAEEPPLAAGVGGTEAVGSRGVWRYGGGIRGCGPRRTWPCRRGSLTRRVPSTSEA